jgi:hypothetical protein
MQPRNEYKRMCASCSHVCMHEQPGTKTIFMFACMNNQERKKTCVSVVCACVHVCNQEMNTNVCVLHVFMFACMNNQERKQTCVWVVCSCQPRNEYKRMCTSCIHVHMYEQPGTKTNVCVGRVFHVCMYPKHTMCSRMKHTQLQAQQTGSLPCGD